MNTIYRTVLVIAALFPLSLLAQPLSGTYTVGNTGTYTSITQAINDLSINGVSGATVFELQADYTSASEIFPITIPFINGASATNPITFRPDDSAGVITINSGIQTVFVFDNAQHIIIDGRPGGTCSSKSLLITNSGGTNPAIKLQNDACFNQVKYDSIIVDSAVAISFLSTNAVLGNDSNLIAYNHIASDMNKTKHLIYALGNTNNDDIFNNYNIIRGNNFTGFGTIVGTDTTMGIYIRNGNSSWIIEDNSFYNATEISSPGSTLFIGVFVNLQAEAFFTIRNNFIGGSLPLCQGNAFRIRSYVSSRVTLFTGIQINTGLSPTPSVIQGNRIDNIYAYSLSGVILRGIFLSGTFGHTNVIGNLIGSDDTTGGIYTNITNTSTGAEMSGIHFSGNISDNPTVFNIRNNRIGNFQSLAPTSLFNITGINIRITNNSGNAGSLHVSGNTIGNSFKRNIASNKNNITGIYVSSSFAFPCNVYDNTIRNLFVRTGGNDALVNGIAFASGAANIYRNEIYNLSSCATSTSSSNGSSVHGIFCATGAGFSIIRKNHIYNLSHDSLKFRDAGLFGINVSGNANTRVEENLIHDFYAINAPGILPGDIVYIYGIRTDLAKVNNNMIRLGFDADGKTLNTQCNIKGIYINSGVATLAHNSVYIGGDSANNAPSSAVFLLSSTGANLSNNILVNNRSTLGTGNALHYALEFGAKPSTFNAFTSRANIFHTTGKRSAIVSRVDSSFTNLQTFSRSMNDSGSAQGNPNFIDPQGTGVTVNLHLQSPTPAEGKGVPFSSVAIDIDSNIRASFTPVDIGADAGNFNYTEGVPPVIVLKPLTTTGLTGNRTLSANISDASGVFLTDSLSPRAYFKKGLNGTWLSAAGTLDSGTVYSGKWNFEINNIAMSGASGDTIYYFVVAQDSSALRNISEAGTDTRNLSTFPPKPVSYRIVTGFSGTYNIGAGYTYTSLTSTAGFFQRLNAGTVIGDVTLLISGDIAETGQFPLFKWVNEGSRKFTIAIRPDTSVKRTLSGTLATSLITIRGVEGLTIDGSYNGSGRYLTFRNMHSGAGMAVSLNDDCRLDTIRNCILEGRATSSTTSALLIIYSSCDSIMIMNNMVRKDTTANFMPDFLIMVASYGSRIANHISIINNDLDNCRYNYIDVKSTSNSVIYGNHIYQSVNLPGTANHSAHIGISVDGGTNHLIRQNHIGGKERFRGGAPMRYLEKITFYGIYSPNASTGNVLVDSNSIGNITAEKFQGISIRSASANITANKIGSGLNASDSIRVLYESYLIYARGWADSNTYNVRNNIIGNIFVNGFNHAGPSKNAGIYYESGKGEISENLISNIKSTDHGTLEQHAIFVSSSFDQFVNIHHNRIDSIVNARGQADVAGIYILNLGRARVSYNRISRIFNTDFAGPLNGIYYAYTDTIQIDNNEIFLNGPDNEYTNIMVGICSKDPNGCLGSVYNNTVLLTGKSQNHSDYTAGLFLANPNNTRVFNNILYNKSIEADNEPMPALGFGIAPTMAQLQDVMGYNLMVVNDSNKAYRLGMYDYGSQNTTNFINSNGKTNTNWIERTDRLPAHLLFEDTLTGDLDIRTNNDACWYVNGKGIALANVTDDIHGNPRFTSIVNGTTDIGADEFSPDMGVLPHSIELSNVAAADYAFVFAGRVLGYLQWDIRTVAMPTPTLRYYSGVAAPSLLPGADHFNAYHELTMTGMGVHYYYMRALFDSSCMGTVANKADIRMAVNQGSWTYAGGGLAATYPFYMHDMTTTFSWSALFTGTTATNPLPVKLLTFSGIKQNKDVLLNWKTASEINTDVFVIERSYNGKTFEAIGEVKAKGNTNTTTSYQYTDKNVRPDQTIYYRLKINDNNGYSEFSKTVMITPSQAEASVSVYPNPSASNFFLHINAAQSSSTKIILYDMTGREVQTAETMLHKGSQDVEISTEHLQAGIYFVTTDVNGEKQTIKVIKQ